MREQDLNYQHLRYFRAVAREGAVHRAARQLHLAPSTVSAQIKTFEEHLGRALFERVGRGLVLTTFGRQVLAAAEGVFSAGQAIAALADGRVRRELRIGVSTVLPKLLVREMLLPAIQPDLTLVIEHGTIESLFGALAVRRIEAVLSDRPTPAWVTAETHDHLVASSSIAVFGTAAFRSVIGSDLPGGLGRVPWIVPPAGTALRAGLEHWWEAHGLAPELAAVVDDSAVVKALGGAGVGVFAAPARMSVAIVHGYDVEVIGVTDAIQERAYVTTRLATPTEPALVARGTSLDARARTELGDGGRG